MERAIAEADLFVVLLSPNFLTSAWCRHERDVALLREIDFGSDRQFIYVLKVAETSRPESGFLRSYDQLNATAPLTEGKLKAIGSLSTSTPNRRRPVSPPSGPRWSSATVTTNWTQW